MNSNHLIERGLRALGLHRRLLMRGESAVAWIGLGLGALLLAAMSALAWWSVRTHGQSLKESGRARVAAVTETLAAVAEPMIAADAFSDLRRALIEASRDDAIASASIVTGDGGVVAHSDPSRITATTLPQMLPGVPIDAAGGVEGESRVLHIPGRGRLILTVTPGERDSWAAQWEMLAGLGAIGAASLVALLVVYRRLRGRLGALGAVRDALLLAAEGETCPDVLLVGEAMGPVGLAWNELVRDREALRERVEAEQAGEVLRSSGRSSGELRDACDALWLGFLVVDAECRVCYANGAASLFLQRQREELGNADLREIVGDASFTDAIEGVATGRLRQRQSVVIERAGDSSAVLRFSLRPIRREDRGVAMIVIEDISQQRVAEDARSQFVAHATHELRTPLTNIRLYVEEAIDLPETEHHERARCLNVINQEARRLERVVGDMLSVSEIEAGSLKLSVGEVRLEALFPELREDYQAQADHKGVELVFDLPPKYPLMRGDREKLGVALHNLIGNALKYTPRGGRVEVKVDADDAMLTVAVKDTGIGISEEDQQRIFERFGRAGDDRVAAIGGSGLGLTIAREIARLHGGDISLESALNEGSTFTLTVPTVAGVASKAA